MSVRRRAKANRRPQPKNVVLIQVNNLPTGNALAAQVEFGLLGLPSGPMIEVPQDGGVSDWCLPTQTTSVITDCIGLVPAADSDGSEMVAAVHGTDCQKSLFVLNTAPDVDGNYMPPCSRHGYLAMKVDDFTRSMWGAAK